MQVIGVPLTEIANDAYADPRQRQLFKNIIYVGVLSVLLDMDVGVFEALRRAVPRQGSGCSARTCSALKLGRDWATASGLTHRPARAPGRQGGRAHLRRRQLRRGARLRVRRRDGGGLVPDHALVVGGRVVQKYCEKYRVDPSTGQHRFAIVQAEDEIASIGMVVGAGWNGARAFTATSGPGVSLMTEFIGLAYFAEIPVTIIDVQRGGPSTGMPTRTQQADLLSSAYASHGDTKHVLLLPEDPHECFEHAAAALDLADRLQTPVFVMTDLDIGMNQRLCEALRLGRGAGLRPRQGDDRRGARGRPRLRPLQRDVDGDGIPWRTLPGTHPSRAPTSRAAPRATPMRATPSAAPTTSTTWSGCCEEVPHRGRAGAAAGAAPGGQADAPGRHLLRLHQPGHARGAGSARARGRDARRDAAARLPLPDSVPEFIAAHEKVFVVEQNRDGQMQTLLVNELGVDPPSWCACCTSTARRSPHASSPARSARRRSGRNSRDVYRQAPASPPRPLTKNKVGYTRRDYEGRISTLCAGCGHDSISAAIVQACWELDIEPHRVAKLSGIGCSSKTPDYFLGASHGFNTVHGRMPSVLTGANLANRSLLYLGVSGDGDSASIGLGQFAHAMRRGVRMAYIVENNGVYGLTKGQFSATADLGSKSKKGVVNHDNPVDLVGMALQLGATYVARSFSGDKEQLVPLIKGAMAHGGAAFIDVISPASPSTTTAAAPRATTTCASTTRR